MKKVDLNCDIGESFGVYRIGQDELVLTHVTSANIACGYHAGDPATMYKTIKIALEKDVGIGAHPGYPDLLGFGRRPMQMEPRDIYYMVMYQIAALKGMAEGLGGSIQHVKPHGALFNTAAQEPAIAEAIAEAVYHTTPDAILFGLAGSELVLAGQRLGLKTANEVFADRTYQPDGRLTPRTREKAIIHDVHLALEQVVRMVEEKRVIAVDGSSVHIEADTICVHGDEPNALLFVEQLKTELKKNYIHVESIGKWKS